MFQKLTVAYIPESKNIAKEYLFERLAEDSAFLATDSLYGAFYDDQKNKTIGKLYNVKKDLYAISWYDSLFKSLITITDSLMYEKKQEVQTLDSLNAVSPVSNYQMQRDSLLDGLQILQQTRENLFSQRALFVDGKITDALTKNSAVVSQRLPEINRRFMNRMEILYERYGEDSLVPYYSQILVIAQQCPYAGGPAVYIARTFVAIFNDDIDYNDDATCLQSGIYREAEDTIELNATGQPEISIIPNPADEKIEIRLNNSAEGICKIEILSALGTIVTKNEMHCKEKTHSISTRNIVPGIYMVKVHGNNIAFKIVKLIIAR